MSRYPRDSQKSKVLRAEKVLATVTNQDIAKLNKFSDTVIRSRWWSTKAKGVVKDPREIRVVPAYQELECLEYAISRGNGVWVPRQRHFILHALAHKLIPPNSERALHSPAFLNTYLQMVDRFMGKEQAKTLRDALLKEKAKIRAWSPEAREKAFERTIMRRYSEAEQATRRLLERLEGDNEA